MSVCGWVRGGDGEVAAAANPPFPLRVCGRVGEVAAARREESISPVSASRPLPLPSLRNGKGLFAGRFRCAQRARKKPNGSADPTPRWVRGRKRTPARVGARILPERVRGRRNGIAAAGKREEARRIGAPLPRLIPSDGRGFPCADTARLRAASRTSSARGRRSLRRFRLHRR